AERHGIRSFRCAEDSGTDERIEHDLLERARLAVPGLPRTEVQLEVGQKRVVDLGIGREALCVLAEGGLRCSGMRQPVAKRNKGRRFCGECNSAVLAAQIEDLVEIVVFGEGVEAGGEAKL